MHVIEPTNIMTSNHHQPTNQPQDLSPCSKLADGLRKDVSKVAALLGQSEASVAEAEMKSFGELLLLF
jgi:hypothetical protein